MTTFEEVKKSALLLSGKNTIAVAAAEDEDVLLALKEARQTMGVDPILVGDKNCIIEILRKINFPLPECSIIHEADPCQAARRAVSLVKNQEANIIMKGLIGTAPFLKAILEKDTGLRSGNILSHVAVFEIPMLDKLLIITDCGINISPNIQEKVEIINNAVQVSQVIHDHKAKVAAVCAVETVNQNMSATIDAAMLAKMSERGQISGAIVDGPLGLDNAISKEAAVHKKISSPVAGQADIILVPNIEVGNVMYKTLVYCTKTSNAGIVMGAAAPVVLTSRADSSETKLNSIALSILVASENDQMKRFAC